MWEEEKMFWWRDISVYSSWCSVPWRARLLKVPGGLAGKLNKKCKNGILQCPCLKPVYHMRTSQQHETQKPQPWLNHTILQGKLFFFLCLYMLRRLSCIFGFPEVIISNCMLTPQHSLRMQYQVHK